MAREIDLKREGKVSTNYNSRYSITRFIPIEELEYETGEVETRMDLLNWRLVTLFNKIDQWSSIKYDGTLPITTIAFRTYGTTTLWWVIMMYNGFIHPLEIEQGVTIRLPALGQIDNFLNQMDRERNRAGTKIIVI